MMKETWLRKLPAISGTRDSQADTEIVILPQIPIIMYFNGKIKIKVNTEIV